MNGHVLLPSSGEMVRFALEVAQSKPDMDWRDVARWVRQNTIPMGQSKRESIRLLRERFTDPDEVVERLMDRWVEIVRFVVT